MKTIRIQIGAIATVCLALGYAMPVPATAAAVSITADATDFSAARRGGGGPPRAGGGAARNVSVNRNVNVNVNRNVTRNVTTVNRRAGVVVRPVRGWSHRPYYGAIIGGVAL